MLRRIAFVLFLVVVKIIHMLEFCLIKVYTNELVAAVTRASNLEPRRRSPFFIVSDGASEAAAEVEFYQYGP